MILVWASVFNASNLEARKALSVETNKADDEFAISLPKGWTTKRDVMGNQLLSEFEKPLEGQRPVKALLMFSNQGLNLVTPDYNGMKRCSNQGKILANRSVG